MITPLENYVVLEEIKTDELIKSSIILEDADVEKPNIALIVATGPKLSREIKVGDRVLFLYQMFTEVTIDKVKYLIGKDEGVIAHA